MYSRLMSQDADLFELADQARLDPDMKILTTSEVASHPAFAGLSPNQVVVTTDLQREYLDIHSKFEALVEASEEGLTSIEFDRHYAELKPLWEEMSPEEQQVIRDLNLRG